MIETQIQDIIGAEAFQKLQDLCGGEQIYIPKEKKKARVRRLYIDKNYSIRRIIRITGLSRATVYRLIGNKRN